MIPSGKRSEKREKKKSQQMTSPRNEHKTINPLYLAHHKTKVEPDPQTSLSPPLSPTSSSTPSKEELKRESDSVSVDTGITEQTVQLRNSKTQRQSSTLPKTPPETYPIIHTTSSPSFLEGQKPQRPTVVPSISLSLNTQNSEHQKIEERIPRSMLNFDNNLKDFFRKETSISFKKNLHQSFEFDPEAWLLFPTKPHRNVDDKEKEKEKVFLNPIHHSRVSLFQTITRRKFQVLTELSKLIDMMDYDPLSKALLEITPFYSFTSKLLKWAVETEIKNTNVWNSLFRSSSLCTQVLSSFCQKSGRSYLEEIIKPFILEVYSFNSSFELDRNKLNEGEKVEENLKNLILTCQKLVFIICNSISSFPRGFRILLKLTQKKQLEMFPDSEPFIALGSFLFLRFICPALVSPDGYALCSESPSIQTRRNLILISKVLQSLGNQTDFGSKEDYMSGVNPFVSCSLPAISSFFTQLVDVDENDLLEEDIIPLKIDPFFSNELYHDPFEYLEYHLKVNQHEIEKKISSILINPLPKSETKKPRTELVHSLHQELRLAALNRDLTYGSDSVSGQELLRASLACSSHARVRSRTKTQTDPNLANSTTTTTTTTTLNRLTSDPMENLSSLSNDNLLTPIKSPPDLVQVLQTELELLRTKLEAEIDAKVQITRKYRQVQKQLRDKEKENLKLKVKIFEMSRISSLNSSTSSLSSVQSLSPHSSTSLS